MKYLISEVLKEKFAVKVNDKVERDKLLSVYEENGVTWLNDDKPTEYEPNENYPFYIENDFKIITHSSFEPSSDKYTIISFNDINLINVMLILLKYGRKEFKYGDPNYSIAYDHSEDEIVARREYYWQDYSPVYFDNEELLKKAVEEAGEDNVKEQLFGIESKPKKLLGYKVVVPYKIFSRIGNFLDIYSTFEKEDGAEISAIDYFSSNRYNLSNDVIEELFTNGSDYTWFIPYDHLKIVYEGDQ